MIGPFAFKPKGTVSARAFLIGRALVKKGHQVTILLPPYDNPADSSRKWEQGGVRLENMRLRRDDAWHKLIVPLRMALRTARLRPDVVHVFKPIAYSGLVGMYLRCLSRLPVVLDTDDWEGAGGWSDVNRYPAHWRRFFGWQERWLARHAHAVTVASRTLQTQIQGFGVEPEKVLYLPNGPDPALSEAGQIDGDEILEIRRRLGVVDRPFALYLGHIPLGTDLDLALDALLLVRERMPEVRLVIAGVGDGRAGLQDHARTLGVEDMVSFPGWIEHERAPAYLAAADVIVNPYRDTLINRSKCAGKVVAAMAMGRAVVTSRVGENLAYIEHERSGLLVEPGDVAALAEALVDVLADRSRAEALGTAAKQRIWEHFSWGGRIRRVEDLYRHAIASQGTAS
jgi:glycosyltransferase involved in cell wall biosynthesis